MNVPSLRPATPGDAAALAELIRYCFARQTVVTDPLPSALKETAESIGAHFGKGGGGALFEGPVACLLWDEAEGGLYVGRLAVHPDWRGRSLAKRLIAAAETEARAQAAQAASLDSSRAAR